MNNKRITKTQRMADIKAMLMGEVPEFGTTIEEACDFIDHERELLAKKNTNDKKDAENERYRELILNYLSTQTEGVTCAEIQRSVPDFADYQNQKIASLLRPLLDAKKVNRVSKGGKTLFSLA